MCIYYFMLSGWTKICKRVLKYIYTVKPDLKWIKKSYIDRISGLKDVNFKKENILNAC